MRHLLRFSKRKNGTNLLNQTQVYYLNKTSSLKTCNMKKIIFLSATALLFSIVGMAQSTELTKTDKKQT